MEFTHIPNVIHGNAARADQIFMDGEISTSNAAMKQLSTLLMARAMELGVHGILHSDDSRSDVISGQAFQDTGMELWALALQAQSLIEISGFAGRSSLVVVPWEGAGGEFSIGARPMLDSGQGNVPVSISTYALDAAAEHAMCMGIAARGYTLDQWDQLPDEIGSGERDIQFDGYLIDLELSWAPMLQATENGVVAVPAVDQISRWPSLLHKESIQSDLGAYERILESHKMGGRQQLAEMLQPEKSGKPQPKPAGPTMG